MRLGQFSQLACLLVLFSGVGSAGAQEPSAPSPPAAIAEDLETFAALLAQDLRLLYGGHPPKTASESPDSDIVVGTLDARLGAGSITDLDASSLLVFTDPLGKPEGEIIPLAEHLPGLGAIIQVRVPAPRIESSQPVVERTPAAEQWERARGALRRDEPQQQGCAACHVTDFNSIEIAFAPRPSADQLLESLTKLLRDHGHRLRGVAPQERVSIGASFWSNPDGSHWQALLHPQGSQWTPKQSLVPPARGPKEKELFARRIYLDITGELPTPEQIKEFIEDDQADADQRLIHGLVARQGVGGESLARLVEQRLRREEHLHAQSQTQAVRFPARGRLLVSALRSDLEAHQRGELSEQELRKRLTIQRFLPGQE